MIQLVAVSKQYLYGAKVLGAVDMTVNNGEIVALLGGEQSGKTTFIKVAGGGTECEGQVLVDGAPIVTKTNDIIIVFDDLAMFDYKSVYYNLAYPLIFRGYSKQEIDVRVKQSAQQMGVVALLYDKAKKLSLIDKKRVAIARLFSRDAKVILVDDITSGLSREDADILWSEVAPVLLEKARQGASVIFSTTSKDEALSIADRIAVLHYGEIKQVGTPQVIWHTPSNIWAVQALDCDYHFERAQLCVVDGRLQATLEGDCLLDISHLQGKIPQEYCDKAVYIGWHSNAFDVSGQRIEDVSYALAAFDGYVLTTASGKRVHTDKKLQKVGTLPIIDRVALFDLYNECSLV